jgi:hypothetical protein
MGNHTLICTEGKGRRDRIRNEIFGDEIGI